MSRHAIIADRYLYLSYVGIAFLISYFSYVIKLHVKKFYIVILVLCVYIISLSTYSFQYTKRWKNSDEVKEYTRELVKERLKQE